ncbi:MAG: septum formation initiator family protein [Prevotella sp.]|nr:septum formation initiator family protein [Prevotella sp.]
MSRIHSFWKFLGHYKYLIAIVVGVAIVGFLDENSYTKRIQQKAQIDELREEIAIYDKRNKADSLLLDKLERDPKAIEKVARERYFMKSDDEDIFVLSDEIRN